MPTIIYVHGFLSSPQSHKAMLTKAWLSQQSLAIDYRCPYLSPYPDAAQTQLRDLMEELEGQQVGFIGSSWEAFGPLG